MPYKLFNDFFSCFHVLQIICLLIRLQFFSFFFELLGSLDFFLWNSIFCQFFPMEYFFIGSTCFALHHEWLLGSYTSYEDKNQFLRFYNKIVWHMEHAHGLKFLHSTQKGNLWPICVIWFPMQVFSHQRWLLGTWTYYLDSNNVLHHNREFYVLWTMHVIDTTT